MKNILLSILMVFAIGLSIPSANVNSTLNIAIQKDEKEYNICATDFTELLDSNSFSSSPAAVKSVIIPPVPADPLAVKRLYLKHYFSNLTENFGENSKGSCGYVALGMMLSYYDTYACDNIIPEQYDIVSTGDSNDMIARHNSPGILYDKVSSDSNFIASLTNRQYYELLKQKFGTNSFQLYLFDYANEINFADMESEEIDFGLKISKLYDIMSYYLVSRGYKYGSSYTADYEYYGNEKTIRQFIIDNIDMGRPVCVAGADSDNNGHAFVCYDYDSIDKIYAHMGWHGEQYIRVDPFIKYGKKIMAFTFDILTEHSHSNNYKVGNTSYCYCSDDIITYHNHSYDTAINLDKNRHRLFCSCGKYKDSQHWIRGSESSGRYANCAVCGALIDLWSDVIIGIMSLSKTPNGSYIHPSGIPVIMEEDVEAYLNGTLKFGNGISNYDYI